jgi:hypothetical protein
VGGRQDSRPREVSITPIMFSRITLAILAVVLILTVVALASDPGWSLADEMAYSIQDEH